MRGDERRIRVRAFSVVLEGGTAGTVITLQDKTGEWRALQALAKSEEHHSSHFEGRNEVVCHLSHDYSLTFLNTIWLQALGYARDDSIGRSFLEYIGTDQRTKFIDAVSTLTNGEVRTCTLPMSHADGSIRVLSWTIRLMPGGFMMPGKYQAVGRVITDTREETDCNTRYSQKIGLLARLCAAFLEVTQPAEVYQMIADHIRALLPAARAVLVCTSSAGETKLELIAYAGDLPRDRLCFLIDEGTVAVNSAGTLSFLHDLSETRIARVNQAELEAFVMGELPLKAKDDVIGLLQEFRTGESYCLLLMQDQDSVTFAVVLLSRGCHLFEDPNLLLTYITSAAVALAYANTTSLVAEIDAKVRLMCETVPQPIAVIAPDRKYHYLNQAFTALFGYTLDDISDERHGSELAFLDPSLGRRPDKSWVLDPSISWAGEEQPHTLEVQCKNAMKKSVMVRSITFPDRYQYLIFTNLSDASEAGEVRSHLAAIFRSSHDGIIGTTKEGVVMRWNPAAEEIYGYTAEEAVGRHISFLAPSHLIHEVHEILEKIRNGKKIEEYETQRVRKDGRSVQVLVSISPTRDRGGSVVGATMFIRELPFCQSGLEAPTLTHLLHSPTKRK
ncbi:MAG: PAS domain S-box protein [Methanomicrobiales archaeon]|nr:PAS domain S-box protein [Methanomicrobiales archaeon]